MVGKTFRILPAVLAVLLLTIIPGCDQAEPIGAPDYADAIAEGVLQAFSDGDYAAYSEHFDDATKEAISETVFEGTREFIRDRVGDYISKEISQVEKQDAKTTVTFKAKFSDEPDDVKVTIVFQETDGIVYVAGLWFDSPKLRKM